jgi:hypothetical protein
MLPCLLNKTRCVFKKTSDGETPKQDTSLELLSLRGKWVTTTHLGKKGQNSLLSSSKFAKKKREVEINLENTSGLFRPTVTHVPSRLLDN